MGSEERIAYYENLMDRAEQAAQQLEDALTAFEAVLPAVRELESYYSGTEWREDFEADEAGLLSADLKRGVLSEDGLYNLLDRYKELEEQISTPRILQL